MRAQVNENIKELGYDVTVPEFEIKYGEIIVNGGESKVNKKDINYYSSIRDNFYVTISPPMDMQGSVLVMSINFTTPSETAEDFAAVASGIIATIDPEADIDEIMESLKMKQTDEDSKLEYSSKTNNYTYSCESEAGRYKTFTVHQR